MKTSNHARLISLALCALLLSGCVGKIVGAVVDTTIEVVKVPFKVGGALIDVATPNKKNRSKKNQDSDEEDDAQ